MRLQLAILLIAFCPSFLLAADEHTGIEFFEKKIRPVLIEHCYECHSADAKAVKGSLLLDTRDGWKLGGDSGAALIPGKPVESLLIKALKYEDGLEMPPKGKLSPEVVADFVKWVEMGAPDPRKQAAKPIAKREIDIEAGKKFWSFKPISHPKPPTVKAMDWPHSDIDRFVLAQQETAGLRPTKDADRVAWLRRVSFDLTGLPPTADEIDRFLTDDSPDVRERIVERLLASPHFGERWGRHWLDIARFAESSGGGRSMIFPEAWRYRDYVIRSFNDDKPFDRFVLEQLAGDLLPFESPAQQEEQIVATALLALGPTNYEEQDKQALEFDVVDEQLDTLGKGLLGMTIGCARCHDHKFDPIPHRDYYALAGIFRSSHLLLHDNVSKWLERPLPVSPEQAAALSQHDLVVANLKKEIEAVKAEEKRLASAKKNSATAADDDAPGTPRGPIEPKAFAGIVLDDSDAKKVGDWTHSQFSRHYIGDGYTHDGNKDKGKKTLTFSPSVPKAGLYEVRLAYNSGESRATNVPFEILHLDGEFEGKINQRVEPPIDHRFVSLGTFRFDTSGQWYVIISNEGTNGHVIADALQLLPVEKPDPKVESLQAKSAATKPTAAKSTVAKSADIKELEKQLKELSDRAPYRPTAMSIEEANQIEETNIRIRGNVHSKGEKVPRGYLQVASYGELKLPPANASGRRELAEWISSSSNPLTARVLANRVWHHLFGVGLVRTVDNFGMTGETPSHPELLDHLATRLLDNGWSVKSLVREIVLSRTYGLSCIAQASTLKSQTLIDPENRLLSRQNRRRLTAEAIRDAMLLTSDSLDRTMYGRTMKSSKQDGPNANVGEMTYVFDDVRRSVYTPIFRNRLLEIFEAFDFADPNLAIGRRNVTTVPTQALYFMNAPFVMDQSRDAARELLSRPELTDEQRVEWAYQIALSRGPTVKESQLALRVVSSTSENTTPSPIAWERLFQALFASVDFRYLD